MTKLFNLYIADVKSQLTCNATKEDKDRIITYNYSNEDIDANLGYFQERMREGLSAYKALLFFGEYLGLDSLD